MIFPPLGFVVTVPLLNTDIPNPSGPLPSIPVSVIFPPPDVTVPLTSLTRMPTLFAPLDEPPVPVNETNPVPPALTVL